MRAIFIAHPKGDPTPKTIPDDDSLGAAWVSLEDLSQYALRGDEVREVLEYVAGGGLAFPTNLIQTEGMPFV